MEEEVPIFFDDESRIRVLDPEKFKHTEELAEQCTAFVESKLPDSISCWF